MWPAISKRNHSFGTVCRHSEPACHIKLCSVPIKPDVINYCGWWNDNIVKKTTQQVLSHFYHFPSVVCCNIPITVRSLTFRVKINTDFPDVNLLEKSDKREEAESGGVERKCQKFTDFKINENMLISEITIWILPSFNPIKTFTAVSHWLFFPSLTPPRRYRLLGLPVSKTHNRRGLVTGVCLGWKKPAKQPSQDPFCLREEPNKWHGFGFIGRGLQPGGKLQRGLGSTVATLLPSVVTVCSHRHANPSLPSTPSWKHPRGSAPARLFQDEELAEQGAQRPEVDGMWNADRVGTKNVRLGGKSKR